MIPLSVYLIISGAIGFMLALGVSIYMTRLERKMRKFAESYKKVVRVDYIPRQGVLSGYSAYFLECGHRIYINDRETFPCEECRNAQ